MIRAGLIAHCHCGGEYKPERVLHADASIGPTYFRCARCQQISPAVPSPLYRCHVPARSVIRLRAEEWTTTR